ncbi:hypothetical protein CDD83_1422 [Cordyceps sp. RAO-2017]|nr:hypothetical protein CDD83_1422 [Cordyceps sp. RAO-2017]
MIFLPSAATVQRLAVHLPRILTLLPLPGPLVARGRAAAAGINQYSPLVWSRFCEPALARLEGEALRSKGRGEGRKGPLEEGVGPGKEVSPGRVGPGEGEAEEAKEADEGETGGGGPFASAIGSFAPQTMIVVEFACPKRRPSEPAPLCVGRYDVVDAPPLRRLGGESDGQSSGHSPEPSVLPDSLLNELGSTRLNSLCSRCVASGTGQGRDAAVSRGLKGKEEGWP